MNDFDSPSSESPTEEYKTYKRVSVYSLLYPLAYTLYFSFAASPEPTIFHLHALFGGFGVCTFITMAVFAKRLGKTDWHGNLMFACATCLAIAVGIAFGDKGNRNKPHFVSNHARLGLFVFFLFTAGPVVSWVLFNPAMGKMKTHRAARRIHKWFGRLVVGVSFATLGLGLYKWTGERSPIMFAVLGVGELVILPFILV